MKVVPSVAVSPSALTRNEAICARVTDSSGQYAPLPQPLVIAAAAIASMLDSCGLPSSSQKDPKASAVESLIVTTVNTMVSASITVRPLMRPRHIAMKDIPSLVPQTSPAEQPSKVTSKMPHIVTSSSPCVIMRVMRRRGGDRPPVQKAQRRQLRSTPKR